MFGMPSLFLTKSFFSVFRQAEVLKADMTGIGYSFVFHNLFYSIKLKKVSSFLYYL